MCIRDRGVGIYQLLLLDVCDLVHGRLHVVRQLGKNILLAADLDGQSLSLIHIFRVGPGVRTGFRIRIDDPSQLGGDLVADTLAGLTEYGAPLIILDAGTVTTLAVVDSSRTYLGGCILPGIRSSATLLKSTTCLLYTSKARRN